MSPWWHRQRGLLEHALASMSRHRAKNVGVGLVHTVLVAALASVMWLTTALRHEAEHALAAAPEVVVQGLQMGRHALSSAADLEALRGIRGVQRVQGRLWGYLYDTSTAATYTLQVPADEAAALMPAPGEALVGEGVARLRRLQTGGRLYLVAPSGEFLNLRVRSVLDPASAGFSSDLVLLNETDFRRFFRLPADVYTDLSLSVRNPKEVPKVAEKAGLALRSHRVITREDLLRSYQHLFSWREGLLLALGAAALLAFAILAFDKASGLSAAERHEIGVLKALGWDTRDILHWKLWEAGVVAGSALVLGSLLAYAHVFVLGAPLLRPVLQGWSVLFPRADWVPVIDGLQWATLAMLAVLPYLAAIVWPVWRTAAADPDEVLR
ncbi:ABC transporter permease [Ideonella sp. 4Y11]|uniref:ABC transporter permease n=1 Tax=Ideonella aquatica TaxID=2824119 RepID=A0A940YPI6_9BURK|nr:ABC transporter permease [Ideonella aquatica]MBQ0960136.1 ABC transporter permease [Ideonella aquatica]